MSGIVPEGGWTRENFHGKNAAKLIRAFVGVKNRSTIKGIRSLQKFLKPYWEKIREDLFRKVQASHARRHGTRSIKAGVDIDFGPESGMWEQALKDVFAEHGQELIVEMRPKIEATAKDAFNSTTILLNDQPVPDHVMDAALRPRINGLASQVTGLNDTLRSKLGADIQKGLDDGLTVPEMVQRIKERWPQIADNRIPTIARTEMGRAADIGVKAGLKTCDTLGYISVIGCQAIEPGIPEYHGVPTCNIQNVPAHDMDLLEFHINHTGAIVPSGFRGEDGHLPPRPVTSGGAPEGEAADEVVSEATDDSRVQSNAPHAPAPDAPETPKAEDEEEPEQQPDHDATGTSDTGGPVPPIDDDGPIFEVEENGSTDPRFPSTTTTEPEPIPNPPDEDKPPAKLPNAPAVIQRDPIGNLGEHENSTVEDFHEVRKKYNLEYVPHLGEWNSEVGMKPQKFLAQMAKSFNTEAKDFTTGLSIGNRKLVVYVDDGENRMRREINFADRTAENQSLIISEKNKGLGKKIHRDVAKVYDHFGITRVDVRANIDVGAYAWARYGFVPEQRSWEILKATGIKPKLSSLLYKSNISPESEKEVNKLLESDDPKTIRKIAALSEIVASPRDGKLMSLGKALLIGTDWEGSLQLNDPQEYSRYQRYIGGGTKKKKGFVFIFN